MAEVNLYLAVLIFCSALLTRFLHRLRKGLATALADKIVRESELIRVLERDVLLLKEKIAKEDNLEDRVDMFNERFTKEEQLKQISKRTEERLTRIRRNCGIVLFLLIEASRVAVILMNRTQPVFIFTPNLFWPLARIVSYPTGLPGAVSPVVWGVACRQCLLFLLAIYDNRK